MLFKKTRWISIGVSWAYTILKKYSFKQAIAISLGGAIIHKLVQNSLYAQVFVNCLKLPGNFYLLSVRLFIEFPPGKIVAVRPMNNRVYQSSLVSRFCVQRTIWKWLWEKQRKRERELFWESASVQFYLPVKTSSVQMQLVYSWQTKLIQIYYSIYSHSNNFRSFFRDGSYQIRE